MLSEGVPQRQRADRPVHRRRGIPDFSFDADPATGISVYDCTSIYGGLGGSNFRDITSGKAGTYSAGPGWDFVTGVGSDLGMVGK